MGWLSVPDHPPVKPDSLVFLVQQQDQVFLFYLTLGPNLPGLGFTTSRAVDELRKGKILDIMAQHVVRMAFLQFQR
jgi:hypothetical protein